MKKVLIIGASGLVGGALKERLAGEFLAEGTYLKNPAPGLKEMDLNSLPSIESVFQDVSPEIVVLAAAYTNVEGCEENPGLAQKINVSGTENVVSLSVKYKSKIVFFSTDYLFDGKDGPYAEDDKPNPLSVYGKTKLEGEEIIRKELKDYLIIRTTVVYDYDPLSRNFVMQLAGRLGKNETMRVPQDQYGNPTLAEDLAGAVRLLLLAGKTGVFNVVGKDWLPRYEFACVAADALGLDRRLIQPVETSVLGQKAPRPLKGGIRIDKLERETGYRMSGAEDGLRIFKRKMEKYGKK